MNINWALPVVWPGAVYGIEIGIVGTKGVIDVEDTHRDLVLATEDGLSRLGIAKPDAIELAGFAQATDPLRKDGREVLQAEGAYRR